MDEKEIRMRKVIMVGRTGTGKSTIGNCMLQENVFTESDLSTSCTKFSTGQCREVDDIKITSIDTIGVGDTELSQTQVLNRIADVVRMNPEGINCILFVFDGRFSDAEVTAYNLIFKVLFPDSQNHAKLIRNRFKRFRDLTAVATDKNALERDQKTKPIIDDIGRSNVVYINTDRDIGTDFEESGVILRTLIASMNTIYNPKSYQEMVKRIESTEQPEDELKKIVLERLPTSKLVGAAVGRIAENLCNFINLPEFVRNNCSIM